MYPLRLRRDRAEELVNSELTPHQDLPVISPCSLQSEELVCLLASDGSNSSRSSQISLVLILLSPPSRQEKLMSGLNKDEQLNNYVVEFQRMSIESLFSRISAYIPLLEKKKIGEVS